MTTACTICSGPMPPRRGGITCSHSCAIALRKRRIAALPRRTGDELLHATHHHRIHRLSCAEFDALLERAGRRCELCGAPPEPVGERRQMTGLVIDHDHQTEKVRGLVCVRCNQAMRRYDEGYRGLDLAIATYLSLPDPTDPVKNGGAA